MASPSSLYEISGLLDPSTHVRLLHLHPPRKEDNAEGLAAPLRCTLTVIAVENSFSFEAVSYSWGPPCQPRKQLSICGANVDITESLDTVLRHLRHATKIRALWVDQICINQADETERAHQVAMMDRIYGNASRVLIWLGEAADDSDRIMDAWQYIGQQAVNLEMGSYYTLEGLPRLREIFFSRLRHDPQAQQLRALALEAGTLLRDEWQALKAWYARPWFTRVWVVQEFSLNQKPIFICGGKRVPGWHVLLAEQLVHFGYPTVLMDQAVSPDLSNLTFFDDKPTVAFFSLWRRRQKYARGMSGATGDGLLRLLQTVFVGRGMNATDQRDRIYSLLGLAVDRDKLKIKVGYGKHDVRAVFTNTASALIRAGHLEVLSYSQFPKSLDGLPSWVPDWRSHLRPSFEPIPASGDSHLFAAGGDSLPMILPTEDGSNKVGLRGYVVDIVEQAGHEWHSDDSKYYHQNYLSLIRQIQAMHKISTTKNKPIYESDSRRAEAVWRVPIADISYTHLSHTVRASLDIARQYEDFVASSEIMVSAQAGRLSQQQNLRSEIDSYEGSNPSLYKLQMSNVSGMRPFLTESGFIGMAATGTHPGDVVAVFQGGRIPYVVRPVHERNFHFIGEAYCDGMMDGEVLRWSPSEEIFLL